MGELGVQPAPHVNGCQLGQFTRAIGGQLVSLARDVGLLGIGLRTHRHIFARRHRHGASDQTSHAGYQNGTLAGAGSRYAQDQTGGGDNAVIGTQHGGAQPAYVLGPVVFRLNAGHGLLAARQAGETSSSRPVNLRATGARKKITGTPTT